MVDLSGLTILKEAILATIRSKKKKIPAKETSTPAKKADTAKTVKLKTISDGNIDGKYENARFGFAACSDLKDGSVEQLFSTAGCREVLISHYKDCVTGRDSAKTPSKRRTSLMVWVGKGRSKSPQKIGGGNSDSRMSITYEEHMAKSMSTALMVLNAFEKRNKWLRTQVYKTNHMAGTENIIYYFRGSRWWQFAPHTLSLYMLLIRLCKHPDLQKLEKNSSVDTIIKTITGITTGNDTGHASTAKKWLPLLDNRRAIYKDRTLLKNWEAFSSGSEGVRTLTDSNAGDKQTVKRFKEASGK
jgi:hypothetical protein